MGLKAEQDGSQQWTIRPVGHSFTVQPGPDLARAHAAAEQVAGLCEAAPEDLRAAIFGEFDTASRIVDAYPAALLWALACAVEQQCGALPGSEREHEVVSIRNIA